MRQHVATAFGDGPPGRHVLGAFGLQHAALFGGLLLVRANLRDELCSFRIVFPFLWEFRGFFRESVDVAANLRSVLLSRALSDRLVVSAVVLERLRVVDRVP